MLFQNIIKSRLSLVGSKVDKINVEDKSLLSSLPLLFRLICTLDLPVYFQKLFIYMVLYVDIEISIQVTNKLYNFYFVNVHYMVKHDQDLVCLNQITLE